MLDRYDLTRYASGEQPALVDNGNAKQVTFPDLHGNTLGALLRLEAHNIVELKPEHRKKLANIYLRGEKLSPADLFEFEACLDEMVVRKNKFQCVRLIGDVLGDRGKNDALTLLLLKKLCECGVNMTILFSNHDLELIAWRLSQQQDQNTDLIKSVLATPHVVGKDPSKPSDTRRSLNQLIKFLETNRDQTDFINHIIDKFYKPCVKLFDYSYDATEQPPVVTLYSHAPAGIEAVKAFAKMYGVQPFDDSTHEALFNMIDRINEKFSLELINEPNQLGQKLAHDLMAPAKDPKKIDPTNLPFWYIAWQRGAQFLEGVPQNRPYVLKNKHGHLGDVLSPWPANYGFNLDNKNDLGYSSSKTDKNPNTLYGLSCNSLNSDLSSDPVRPKEIKQEESKPSTGGFFSKASMEKKEIKDLLLPYSNNPNFKGLITDTIDSFSLEQAKNLHSAYQILVNAPDRMSFEEACDLNEEKRIIIDNALNAQTGDLTSRVQNAISALHDYDLRKQSQGPGGPGVTSHEEST